MEKKAKKKIIFNDKGSSINQINNTNIIPILKPNKESEKDIKLSKKNSIKSPIAVDEVMNSTSFNFPSLSHRMERIILGGSNFKIITPSSGVNIKEKNQIKTGGINYFKTYHKYSLNEFNKVLKDTLAIERAKLSGNFLIDNINPINKDIITQDKKKWKIKKI